MNNYKKAMVAFSENLEKQSNPVKILSKNHSISGIPVEDWEKMIPGLFSRSAYMPNELFLKNWIYERCITLISKAVSGLPIRQRSNGKDISDNVYNLLTRNPHPLFDYPLFMEYVISNLLLWGNSFIYVNPSKIYPMEFEVLLTKDVYPILSQTDEYPYTGFVNEKRVSVKTYTPDELVFIRTYNPNDLYWGLPFLSSSMRNMTAITKMETFQNAMYENSANMSGILSANEEMDQPDIDAIKAKLRSDFQGVSNAGQILVVGRSMEFKPFGISPKDQQLLESIEVTAALIIAASGIPTELFGNISTNKTYNNFKTALADFYERIAINWCERALVSINKFFYGDSRIDNSGTEMYVNKSEISALRKETADIMSLDCVTLNEKRIMLGLEPIESENMNKIVVNSSVVSLDEALSTNYDNGVL